MKVKTNTHYKPKPIVPIENAASSSEFQPTDDQRYWMRMEEKALYEETSSFVGCTFQPKTPYNLATVAGQTMTLYEMSNHEAFSSYTRFKSQLCSVKYREDGSLLGVSTQGGQLQFFNVHTGSKNKKGPLNPIRTFKAHKSQVGAFDYSPIDRNVASFADDGLVKIFDLTSDNSKPVWSCEAHNDFIRTGAFCPSNGHLMAAGSYDHRITLWDIRQDGTKSVHEFNHEKPVERILFLDPQQDLLASAGETVVKLWNIRAGKLMHQIEFMHRKTVTSLCLATDGQCLITGGIDRRINFVNLTNGEYSKMHSMRVEYPIFSIAIDSTDYSMAIGMSNKLAIYQQKKEEVQQEKAKQTRERKRRKLEKDEENIVPLKTEKKEPKEEEEKLPSVPLVMKREREGIVEKVPIELTERQIDQVKLGTLDYLLREENLHEIVSKIFHSNQHKAEYVVSALQQIRIRQGLENALANQGIQEIGNLFNFLAKNLFQIPYFDFDILFDVAIKAINVYAQKKLSNNVRKIIRAFDNAITKEIALQKEICQTIGTAQMITNWNKIHYVDDDFSVSFYAFPQTETVDGVDMNNSTSTKSNSIHSDLNGQLELEEEELGNLVLVDEVETSDIECN